MAEVSEIPKQFDFSEAEERIYKMWEDKNVFHAEVDQSKPAFCVVIPPPNVTGILHMGHVLDNVPQDVMTRWHRMRGYSSVWIPGTDHAGIATQNVVKRELLKQGIQPEDLGREKFLEKVWEWKEKHGSIIISQLKRLGCSCDWERERFTMDEGLSKAVLAAFIHYYEKGLIYKGKRMINWCTVCGTALANDEVEHANKKSHLWHLKYPILDSSGNKTGSFAIVATTRPETMLGDTAVAVNPEDDRYKDLLGKSVWLPLQERTIPVIADKYVDSEFGTGIVKITPAHDPNDYQMGLNHNLEFITVIGDDGKMTEEAGSKYAGLDRFDARKQVIADLEEQGFLEKIDNHTHAVGQCYRCNSVVEPLVSDQWFVKMKPLAEKAKAAVEDGRIKVVPDSEKHDYYHWMDTIQDWCISRQLWWGHRIPIYYCGDCEHVTASIDTPSSCSKCSSKKLTQDEDVLDTWFSSQLWPFSTLGWPEKTKELDYWFPNNWLMSGRDILFFWDSRMIMSALELMEDVPFKTLALHGLVRDSQGRKLSKSLGNSPDPIGLFEEWGTDAVRAAIALHYPMGRQDTKLSEEVYRKGQSLITKLWNSTRLLFFHLENDTIEFDSSKLELKTVEDKWIISQLSKAISDHDRYLEKSDIVHAIESVNDFFWNDYCDWYLEIIKTRLKSDDKTAALSVAFHCCQTILKLLHPYIPFVTEELWQILRDKGVKDIASPDEELITTAAWPKQENFKVSADAQDAMSIATSIIRGVRDVRSHLVIPPKDKLALSLSFFEGTQAQFDVVKEIVLDLGFISEISIHSDSTPPSGTAPCKFKGGVAYVEIPDTIESAAIVSSLDKKIAKLEKNLQGIDARLNNASFIDNAPAELVEETKANAAECRESIEKLAEFKASLS